MDQAWAHPRKTEGDPINIRHDLKSLGDETAKYMVGKMDAKLRSTQASSSPPHASSVLSFGLPYNQRLGFDQIGGLPRTQEGSTRAKMI
jgi:hypothetical protein